MKVGDGLAGDPAQRGDSERSGRRSGATKGRKVVLGIRPEDLEDHQARRRDGHTAWTLEGTVTLREALGAEIMVHFSVDAPPAFTADVKELAEDVGEAERAEAHAGEGTAVIVGRFGARSRVRPGSTSTSRSTRASFTSSTSTPASACTPEPSEGDQPFTAPAVRPARTYAGRHGQNRRVRVLYGI